MAHCSNCGAPISVGDRPVKCTFCEAMNVPAPREVVVPVPVQVQLVQASPSASPGGSAADRRCPHCKKRLVTVVAGGATLSGCGACGGIWVDNVSARHVLADPQAIFAELARRAAAGATGSRGKVDKPTCAECPAVLDRSVIHGIELDVCAEHGSWFDARELETLVRILRHETAEGNARTAVCQACHEPIAEGRANVTDRGLCCEACWRAEQQRLIALADAQLADQQRTVAVSGVLLGVAAAMLGAAFDSSRS